MKSDDIGARRRPNFPTKLTIVTILVALVGFVAHLLTSELNDWFGLAQDSLNMFTFLAGAVLFLCWVLWFLFLSKMAWVVRIAAILLMFMTPVALWYVLRPTTGGDLSFNRIDPIWNKRAEPAEVTEANAKVDLSVETIDDFPAFLGPNSNAVINTGQRIDKMNFTSGTSLVWKKPIGQGWSGFAARNGYAITMEQRGNDECVTCYAIDSGDLVWIYKHPARHEDMMNMGHVGPRSTPTIFDNSVYSIGAMGNVACLNSDGVLQWQFDVLDHLGIGIEEKTDREGLTYQYEKSTLAWGRAGSPLVTDELVIVPGGAPRDGKATTLLALDRKTGKIKWSAGDEMIGYGSPTLANVAGRNQILLIAESKALGFDLETGNQLWIHDWPGSSETAANTSQPVPFGDDRILLSKGYNVGGEMIRLLPSAEGFKTETVSGWPNPRLLRTKMTSPVVIGEHAYCLSDGFLECTNLVDATRKWKRRGRFGHGQILLKDGLLIVHSEFGRMYLIEPSPVEYIELGNIPTIEGVCWNTICMSGPYVLVRSDMQAACFKFPLLPDDSIDDSETTAAMPTSDAATKTEGN